MAWPVSMPPRSNAPDAVQTLTRSALAATAPLAYARVLGIDVACDRRYRRCPRAPLPWLIPRAMRARWAWGCRPDGLTRIGDTADTGRQFAAGVRRLGARIVRPTRRDAPGSGLHPAPIRQRIASIVTDLHGHP